MYWLIASIKTILKLTGLILLAILLMLSTNIMAGLIIAGLFGIVFLNIDDVIVLIYIILFSLLIFGLWTI